MCKAKSKCRNYNVYVLEAVSDDFSGLAVNKRSVFLRWNFMVLLVIVICKWRCKW